MQHSNKKKKTTIKNTGVQHILESAVETLSSPEQGCVRKDVWHEESVSISLTSCGNRCKKQKTKIEIANLDSKCCKINC